jgi:hypothetical protein
MSREARALPMGRAPPRGARSERFARMTIHKIANTQTTALNIVAPREVFAATLAALPQCEMCESEPATYTEDPDNHFQPNEVLQLCDACAALVPTGVLIELTRALVVRALAAKARAENATPCDACRGIGRREWEDAPCGACRGTGKARLASEGYEP